MFRVKDDQKIGVPNDWDLATTIDATKHSLLERTGTIPFMALDLLASPGISGSIEHMYRHDLEAFFWILIWLSYPDKFQSWQTANAGVCRDQKEKFFRKSLDVNPRYPSLLGVLAILSRAYGTRVTNMQDYIRDVDVAKFIPDEKACEPPRWTNEEPAESWEWFCNNWQAGLRGLQAFAERDGVLNAAQLFFSPSLSPTQ